MFELRDLPDAETLARFQSRYPELDISALQVVLRLARVATDMVHSMAAVFAAHGLSLRRFFIMILLARNPQGLRATELAQRMGVSKATVSNVLDGMLRDELVHIVTDKSDARAKMLTLTPHGDELMQQVLPEHYRRTASFLEGVEEADRAVVLAVLESIETQLKK